MIRQDQGGGFGNEEAILNVDPGGFELANFLEQRFRRQHDAIADVVRDLARAVSVRELEDAAKAIVVLGDESVAMGGLRAVLMKSERGSNGRVSLKQAARAASREAEKELILKVLTRTRWNRRRAAQELQISYKALLYKLKQIGCGDCGSS